MNSTVTISQLQAEAPKCVRRAEKEGAISVSRHGRTVAVLLSRERMEAIIETLEIMGNPKAMAAIRNYEAGRYEPGRARRIALANVLGPALLEAG